MTAKWWSKTHRPTLGHGKDINHSDSVVINELSKHQPHHLHWYTSTTCEGGRMCVGGVEERKERVDKRQNSMHKEMKDGVLCVCV